MTETRLRVGMIGTGDFGPFFAPYVNEVANLVAVCDPNPEALAKFAWQTGMTLPEYDHHEKLLEAACRSAGEGGSIINFPLYPELELESNS